MVLCPTATATETTMKGAPDPWPSVPLAACKKYFAESLKKVVRARQRTFSIQVFVYKFLISCMLTIKFHIAYHESAHLLP